MKYNYSGVSPVVGVMLMLVVTIIIAAVVSGFAGGFAEGQEKVPQATIQGEFSVTSGMKIIHAGGDAIPTADLEITVANGPTFGTNLKTMTTSAINLATVTNSAGTSILAWNNKTNNVDGYNIKSLNPGDTFFINITNCDPEILQPVVWSSHGSYTYDGTHWTFSSPSDSFWALNFVNPDNIGKSFYLDITDKSSGTIISHSLVKISG